MGLLFCVLIIELYYGGQDFQRHRSGSCYIADLGYLDQLKLSPPPLRMGGVYSNGHLNIRLPSTVQNKKINILKHRNCFLYGCWFLIFNFFYFVFIHSNCVQNYVKLCLNRLAPSLLCIHQGDICELKYLLGYFKSNTLRVMKV